MKITLKNFAEKIESSANENVKFYINVSNKDLSSENKWYIELWKSENFSETIVYRSDVSYTISTVRKFIKGNNVEAFDNEFNRDSGIFENEIKEFSTAWLVEEVRLAKELKSTKNAELALHFLICDLENYIDHISKNAHRKGTGTSEKKAAASIANGAKGGRPKGSKNKPKE